MILTELNSKFALQLDMCTGKAKNLLDMGTEAKWPVLQGSIFRSENDIYFPPLLKLYFSPFSRHVVFRLPSWPFCFNCSLFCIYFTLLLPLFSFSFPFLTFFFPLSYFFLSPSSFFLSPFFLFLSPFFLFLLHFLPFSLGLFIFFPPNDIGLYPPPGRDIFQYIHPCHAH